MKIKLIKSANCGKSYLWAIPVAVVALMPFAAQAQQVVGYLTNAGVGTPVAVSSANPLPVTATGGTGTAANQVQGTAATGSALAGNPVRIGLSDGTNAQNACTVSAATAAGTCALAIHVAPTTVAGGATLDTECLTACSSIAAVTGVHNIYNFYGSATVTGYFMLYDATACPANGTVSPKRAYSYPTANAPYAISYGGEPLHVTTGMQWCFSTTGPFTATSSATAFMAAGYE